MMIRNTLFALVLVSVVPSLASAASGRFYRGGSGASGMSFTVEPIMGYERVQKFEPTAHTRDRLFYGLRVLAGKPSISLEGEYTRGEDSESFTDQDLKIRDTDDKAKLGLRSATALGSIVSAYARGGAQYTKNVRERTSAGLTTRTVSDPRYDPYAGAGFGFHLANNVSLDAGITVVFQKWPDMSQNEYQTSAGFSLRFP